MPARTPAPGPSRGAALAALGVLAAQAVTTFRLPDARAQAAARVAGAASLLAIARRAGVSWGDLGLDRHAAARGLRLGAATGATLAACAAGAAALPNARRYFLDARAAEPADALPRELARITFGTVTPEELAYRAALLGIGLAGGSRLRAVAFSSAAFGLSHVLPTIATLPGNPMHRHVGDRPGRWVAAVTANVAVTGLAGVGFAWLRLASGSVLAPLLAHAALNDAALLAGRAAHRRPPRGAVWGSD